ncbi:hypothetical protein BPOR_0587g00040 [Botrytis porri]|uniref:Uncharacterized protein n=1 Tax=Botrytis porri TaxID=87229 RepID=A0A4Z1KEG6_9HELO|nr:hypothetical protein BPOR_0587g00040 [Botrytis porri]
MPWLTGQVIQGRDYLHTILEDGRDAPIELRLLIDELSIIKRISAKFASSTPENPELIAALDFCNESIHKLRDVVDRFGFLTGVGKYKKWGPRLALALNSSKILKRLNRLREAKGHLEHLQNVFKHDETKLKIDNLRNSIKQLNLSNSQISEIVNYSPARVDDIAIMAKETRFLLQNMADKFVKQRERNLESNRLIEKRVVDAMEVILKFYLKKHFRETRDSQSSSSIQSLRQEACNEIPPSNVESWNTALEDPRIPNFERTSNYSTQIGQVLMKTISSTYMSLNEIETEHLEYNSTPMLNTHALSSIEEFPITITRTEILLLPESWEKERAAGNILDNGFTVSQSTGVKVTASPSLLYIAFKAVFVAQGVRHGKARRRKFRKPRRSTSLLRQYPDSEVNDVVELVTLWSAVN